MGEKRVDMFTSKTIRYSLAASVLLFASTTLSAETMYEKFMKMEAKMKQLESEVNDLKAKNEALSKEISSKEESEDEEEAGEEEEEKAATSKVEDDEEEADEEEDASDDEGDDEEDEDDEDEDPKEVLADLQESVEELSKATGNNHLKFNVDYRFSVDNLQYKMAGKDPQTNSDKKKNDALLANRLWLNMSWAATEKLSFKGQLAYFKAFGHRATSGYTPLDDFDWVVAENPYEGEIRVKNAYFLYRDNQLLGTPISWTFSIGRRPSTNGHLINFRDDDTPASPNGHSINVEFDGASAKLGFDEWVQGMYIKFCAGRGLTNASSKFFAVDDNRTLISNPPYAEDPEATPTIDLAGFIFEPYSDGQYTLTTQYYYAMNLIDADIDSAYKFNGFDTVGNMHSITASFIADGIGDEINDFLDDTTFFISGAMSISDPDNGKDMFHAPTDPDYGKSETGYSVWAGVNIPSLISEEGKWGIEYNWGSQYWRSITYAEDTMIGSKVAARGSAYEVYFTEPLVDDILTAQIRYTYIDYDYTGSNGFFGSSTGVAMKISDLPTNQKGAYIDTAQDIRFYIRYRY